MWQEVVSGRCGNRDCLCKGGNYETRLATVCHQDAADSYPYSSRWSVLRGDRDLLSKDIRRILEPIVNTVYNSCHTHCGFNNRLSFANIYTDPCSLGTFGAPTEAAHWIHTPRESTASINYDRLYIPIDQIAHTKLPQQE